MTLVRFEPFRGFERLSKRFGDLANEIEKGVSFEMGGFNPRVDITEDDKNLFVYVEIPGMSKNDVKVVVNEERTLTLKGEKKREIVGEEICCLRSERTFGQFERSFMLPDNVDVEKIQAKYNNGVLELVIPKMEPQKPKEIKVEIN